MCITKRAPTVPIRRRLVLATLASVAFPSSRASAQAVLQAIATFSILRDLIQTIGGEKWQVTALVGPGGDAHHYHATPADSIRLQRAGLLVSNGLGFEAWLPRVVSAAPFRGRHLVASKGIEPLMSAPTGHAKNRTPDPHCWHDIALARRYAANIAEVLGEVDPPGQLDYQRRVGEFDGALAILDTWVREQVARVPTAQRRVVCSHDAFAYFGRAYGVEILTFRSGDHDHAPSAREVARLVSQVREEKVKALFYVHHGSRAQIDQIARETGGTVAGALYSDALSAANGPAATYEAMIRYNVGVLVAGLLRS
ncbi:MAG: metal ABC transporter solute-binding protein, Zn/Mn family [Acidimicrobiia bacterium]